MDQGPQSIMDVSDVVTDILEFVCRTGHVALESGPKIVNSRFQRIEISLSLPEVGSLAFEPDNSLQHLSSARFFGMRFHPHTLHEFARRSHENLWLTRPWRRFFRLGSACHRGAGSGRGLKRIRFPVLAGLAAFFQQPGGGRLDAPSPIDCDHAPGEINPAACFGLAAARFD
jgi:hypothetical protein